MLEDYISQSGGLMRGTRFGKSKDEFGTQVEYGTKFLAFEQQHMRCSTHINRLSASGKLECPNC
jgi:hypothetical protein